MADNEYTQIAITCDRPVPDVGMKRRNLMVSFHAVDPNEYTRVWNSCRYIPNLVATWCHYNNERYGLRGTACFTFRHHHVARRCYDAFVDESNPEPAMLKIVKRNRIKKRTHWYKFKIDTDYHGPSPYEQRAQWWKKRQQWFKDQFPKAYDGWFMDRATADAYVKFCDDEMEYWRVINRLSA